MNVKKFVAKLLGGKDPVDDETKQKAEAALTQFDLTKEDIEREKARVRRRETSQRKKREEKITDVEECAQRAQDSVNTKPRKESKLTPEEVRDKMRALGWIR